MRYILLLLMLGTAPAAFAQKPFRGRIDYTLTSRDSQIVLAISSWYRGDRIYFTVRKSKVPKGMEGEDERIILNFRDGFIERIKDKDRRVEREPLTGPRAKRDLPPLTATGETMTMLSEPAHLFETAGLHKEAWKDSVKTDVTAKAGIWYADKLLFPVPDSMKGVQMVPLFTNGHIALGSEIAVKAGPVDLQLRTRVQRIDRRKPSKKLFTWPRDYVVKDSD